MQGALKLLRAITATFNFILQQRKELSMNCPNCGKEMIHGRTVNCSMRAVALVFKKDGEKFDAKDVFPHKSRIYKDLLAGSELESYYCDSCEKILMLTDCTKS